MNPGQIAFTLMGPRFLAIDSVMVFKAPLEEAYAIELPMPLIPAIEEILTILGFEDSMRCCLHDLTI